MKDGYYWARAKGCDLWEPVHVRNGWLVELGTEVPYPEEDYEFGDRIEIPEKYQ